MKAISIRQPWIWAILSAGKRVENRPRPWAHRGPILLHASKGMTKAEYNLFAMWWVRDFPRRTISSYPKLPDMAELQRGGIIGKAHVLDCIKRPYALGDVLPIGVTPAQAELSVRPWFTGPYGLVLGHVEAIPFIPFPGQLGLFEVPDEIVVPKREIPETVYLEIMGEKVVRT